MKKQLIKETDIKGVVWYKTMYNGIKVTEYTHDENIAIADFERFRPVKPSEEILMEEEIND